ncbi:MAG TPA: hypothetical protein VJ183_09855 [Chloroflexia bacterium]|nr:hypothetical protein [Chloroflexia bacterium]
MVMIDATITADSGRFSEGALPFEATARDGSTIVHSFKAFLSPNGKELHTFFTTEAFEVFPGLFDLDFGFRGRVIGTFENVDISTALIPLPSFYAALGLPNADNDWLASL